MLEAPTGTVTFLFTDIEGSTRLLQELRESYREVQEGHDEIVRAAIAAEDGYVVRTEGDSFFATFRSPVQAIRAAVAAQRALRENDWPHAGPLRVRIGAHTGEGVLGGDDYLGIDVHRAARIAAAGHGGQILISDTTRALVEHALPEGVTIRDLGTHRLKDIEHPERLHDLIIDGLPAEFPALRTLDARATNLPEQRTSFVGRHRELDRIAELLAQTRLLTLTGPGGTGKTRIAMRVASDHLDRFDDGAFLVSLAAVTDADLVPSAIAAALPVRVDPARDPFDSLTDHLRDRNMLLVLDNFEQITDGAPVVDRLLSLAPRLTILVTSRVPLHLSGEQEYHVPPLTLPDPSQVLDMVALGANESVMLFVERAAAVRPGFRITQETAGAVAEITARLDGLPLAIELAASRVKILSPPELLDRLGRRLPLLTGGARDLPERQRTLRAAIEWSYDLLDTDEHRLFARLAVFAGGWSLDAAEAVCGSDVEAEVLDGLGTLVDHSLVRRGRPRGGETRFRMLETIREFAAERLSAAGDEEEEMRRRHARFIRELAEQAEPHLTTDGQAEWLGRLEREHDNLRAALDWADRTGDADTAVRIASAVWRFWQQHGYLAEGRVRLERAMAMPGAQARTAVRVRGLSALGSTAYWQGDHAPLESAWGEALEIAKEIGDVRMVAHALFDYSFVSLMKEDFDAAARLLREGLAVAKDAGDPKLVGSAMQYLGYLSAYRGDLAEGMDLLSQAVAVARETGDQFFLSEALSGLASFEFQTGDLEIAKGHLMEVIRIQIASGNRMGLASTLVPLSLVANNEGRPELAARLYGNADRMREELGGGPPLIAFLGLGDPGEAARQAIGDESYERAWAEGHTMTLDEAIAMALDDDDGSAEA
jgi:predicted ATPase/class 3 adenylate cyclase